MKCKISDATCVYHACMSDDCQKKQVLKTTNFGEGKCFDRMKHLPRGFRTHTMDMTNEWICLGDIVGYDFPDSTSKFEVVFEHNAFRKKIKGWDATLEKPMLEHHFGNSANTMRLKIIKKYNQ